MTQLHQLTKLLAQCLGTYVVHRTGRSQVTHDGARALQLAILLSCIIIGARLGGIALGTVSGIGLAFFMIVLGMPPGNPPAVVLGMILAVITALSMMETYIINDWT